MNLGLEVFILFISLITNGVFTGTIQPTTVTGIISQTTTTFSTPPTQTTTFFITSTPDVHVKYITVINTPSTSVYVTVTVANINLGFRTKFPNFISSQFSTTSTSISGT